MKSQTLKTSLIALFVSGVVANSALASDPAVAANTAGIKANTAAIEANTAGIKANTATITGHTTRIQELQDSKADKAYVDSELAKKANQSDLDAAKADIATNKAAIETNKNDIATNKAAIETNKNDIATNKAAIETNKNDIATNKAAIEINKTNIAINKDNIAINKDNIAINKDNIAINRDNIAVLDYRVTNLEKEVRKGLATQAALTGLFQPYNVGKFNVSAAVGGYRDRTALAVGMGYRFNEKVAAKAGVSTSTSGGGMAYNVGVNFEF